MMIVKMAVRNLMRHRARTLVTGGSLALGVALLLLFEVMEDGSHEQITELDLRLFAGHALVRAKGYEVERDPALLIHGWRRLVPRILSAVEGSVVVPMLETGGTLRSAEGSVILEYLFGVDEREARKERLIPRKILRGHYLTGKKGEIVIGVKAAKTLGVEVGDKVVLTVASHGRRRDEMFTVTGIFSVGGSNDTRIAEVNLAQLQELLGVGDVVSHLAVFRDLKESEEMVSAIKRAVGKVPGVEILTWEEAEPMMAQLLWLDSMGGYVFILIIFLIIEASILNTVLMGIMERRREIGVLLAIGMKPRHVFYEVLWEAAALATVAAVVGAVLFYPVHLYLSTHGLDIREVMGVDSVQMAGVAFTGKIYTKLYVGRAIKSALAVVVLTVLTAVYPAWRATATKPVEVLRKA